MKFDIKDFIDAKQYPQEKANYFSDFKIVDVTLRKNDNACFITIFIIV